MDQGNSRSDTYDSHKMRTKGELYTAHYAAGGFGSLQRGLVNMKFGVWTNQILLKLEAPTLRVLLFYTITITIITIITIIISSDRSSYSFNVLL